MNLGYIALGVSVLWGMFLNKNVAGAKRARNLLQETLRIDNWAQTSKEGHSNHHKDSKVLLVETANDWNKIHHC